LGWINVDREQNAAADQIVDLETLPWPWADNSVGAVKMHHVLEHLGETTKLFLGIMKELYRVARPGAMITITVPHPRSDEFINDPTHVRPITPDLLRLFDQSLNRDWEEAGYSNSPLGLYLDVDFRIRSISFVLDELWAGRVRSGEVDRQQLADIERSQANVIRETTIVLEAVKETARGRGLTPHPATLPSEHAIRPLIG
jgi:hypothetical protein